MIAKFKNHLNSQLPFLKDKKLLVAASGGIDSNVLIYLLHHLKYRIELAHCNFQLRGNESLLDQQSLEDLAKKLKVSIHTVTFDTERYASEHKLSIQIAARELRYQWFEKIRIKNSCDYILTAHHKNDGLETFLINLTRGTGLEGLTGIPQINGCIVRPLLNTTRAEIELYANENQIQWREDETNSSTKYVRNKIRHDIIPILKELNPSLLDSFENTRSHLKASQEIIKDHMDNLTREISSYQGGILRFDIEKILKLPNPKNYLFELLRDYHFREWDDVLHLLTAQSGKQIFSKTHRLLKDREFLLLVPIEEHKQPTSYTIVNSNTEISTHDLVVKLNTRNDNSVENKNSILLDASLLEFPLVLRRWQHGDFFYPKGLKGKKKLSDYFKDEKMSLIEKERIWLLVSNKNEIIWVIGKRKDRRFRVTSKTTSFIEITANQNKH